MRLLNTTRLALLALFVLGSMTSVSASAEEGFLRPGGGHPATFTFSTGIITRETSTGASLSCTSSTGSGTLETDKRGKGSIRIAGCKAAGFPIQDLTDKEKEVILDTKALFQVCLLIGGRFGIILEAGTVHLEAPALGALLTGTGSVVGEILEFSETESKESGKLDLIGSKGKQQITECNDKVVHLAFLESNENGKPEQVSVNVQNATATTAKGEAAIVMDN